MLLSISVARLGFALCLAFASCLSSPAASAAPHVPAPSLEEKQVFRSYKKEMECLAKAIYFEARGEPARGQQLVARVILNRLDSVYYPDTICDVVYQNDHMKNACQFSFACDSAPDRIDEPAAYTLARKIATMTFRCDKECRRSPGGLASSTHYHADYVAPSWSRKLLKMGKVGSHIFYFTASM